MRPSLEALIARSPSSIPLKASTLYQNRIKTKKTLSLCTNQNLYFSPISSNRQINLRSLSPQRGNYRTKSLKMEIKPYFLSRKSIKNSDNLINKYVQFYANRLASTKNLIPKAQEDFKSLHAECSTVKESQTTNNPHLHFKEKANATNKTIGKNKQKFQNLKIREAVIFHNEIEKKTQIELWKKYRVQRPKRFSEEKKVSPQYFQPSPNRQLLQTNPSLRGIVLFHPN